MWMIFFLFYKYLFSYKKENKRLTRYIFVLLYTVFILLIIIGSFSEGLISVLEDGVYKGYGHVYIELERKLYEHQIDQDKILQKLYHHPMVNQVFAYGVIPGMAKFGTIIVPVYLISYYKNSLENIFGSDLAKKNKNGYYVGKLLYEKYALIKYKKIFIPIKENEKKNILYINNLPLTFAGHISCAWDEWNEKAVFCSANKLESYLEHPTLFFLNIYMNKESDVDSFLHYLEKLENKSIIKYYKKSLALLPEYNKFYNLIHFVHAIINSIVMIVSLVLILILLFLYINNNSEEWRLLWYAGISKMDIILSLLLLFAVIYLLAAFLSIISSVIFITIINYYKLVSMALVENITFICKIDLYQIAQYIVIGLLFFMSIAYFLFKKVFKEQYPISD